MIEHEFIRVSEGSDDPDANFAESRLPIVEWTSHGWTLYYLDAHDEVQDHRIAGGRDDVTFAVQQARQYLDSSRSFVFPTD